MTANFLVAQLLNGLQFGFLLFLMAAGLSLIFGIMGVINLAHGSFYMLGAFAAATVQARTGSFIAGLISGVAAVLALGMAIEALVMRHLYCRDHLQHVLATFGLILFFNEATRVLWGGTAQFMALPSAFEGQVQIAAGLSYPAYRLVITAVGGLVATLLYLLLKYTRLGMLIRAGANDRAMVSALGVNIGFLYAVVFGLGAALAALGGIMAGPVLAIEVGMGEHILILAFVVVVLGGVGSVPGSLVAAILVGVADSLGRSLLPLALAQMLAPATVSAVAPAAAAMVVYLLMAAVLLWRPQGLLARSR
jgi:branched-chain amino acid transport system permease protein